MNVLAELPAAKARSERLDAYLAQDPSNEQLLADAFDAAIAANRLEAAGRHVATGISASGSPDWKFRQATLCIAQGRLREAQSVLETLHQESPHPAVGFNLAYVQFHLGRYESSAALLEPLLESAAGAPALWLRSLHQMGHVERAWAWVEGALRAGRTLDAELCGVASLLAVDAEHLAEAAQLADHALKEIPLQTEALVARGSVALAGQNAALAARLATSVIHQREDGRARSLLGFARLLQHDLEKALADLELAVVLMPRHVGTWQGLGWTRLLLKDVTGARAAFSHALALDRNFAESHGALAVALAAAGQTDEARSHIDRAKRLDPHGMAAQYAVLLLSGQGGNQAAIERLASQVLPGLRGDRRGQPRDEDGASRS